MLYYSPIVAALVTFALTCFLLAHKTAAKIQDIPNARSLHSIPVPRTGGIGLMAGVLCSWVLLFDLLVWWLVVPVVVLFVLSILDDIYNLPVKHRLLVQLAAAALLVGGLCLVTEQGWLVTLALLLMVVWMTNLYNFMDGSDGLAGGMTLFGFVEYGVAAILANNTELALLNFCIAAAATSFLYFNFHPAKIFMGDGGSIPLGFLAAAMGLWGWQQGSWALWFPLLVFSPFIVDASVTLLKRALRGDKITEAHREHYYQRLVQLGWGHRNVALAEYVLMLAVGCSALWALNNPFPWPMLLAWGAVYVCLMLLIDTSWKSFKRGKNV